MLSSMYKNSSCSNRFSQSSPLLSPERPAHQPTQDGDSEVVIYEDAGTRRT